MNLALDHPVTVSRWKGRWFAQCRCGFFSRGYEGQAAALREADAHVLLLVRLERQQWQQRTQWARVKEPI